MKKIKLSVLDQSQIRRDSNAREALQESVQLAQYTDTLGYTRYWVSEHHNFKMVAGSAPEVLIPFLASHTKNIRVGSGGIMLPNHSTLKVAENFGLLATIFPDRIDLGIGRAPGGDRLCAYLLNPSNNFEEKEFIQQLIDIRAFLKGDDTEGTMHQKIKAIPIAETLPELWVLTSSGGSAQFAAHFGMALSFAQFINPNGGPQVAAEYRHSFKPSAELTTPKVNVGIFAFCSENEQKIERWRTEFDYRMLHIESGATGPLPSFEEISSMQYNEAQKARIMYNRGRFIAGTPEQVKEKLMKIISDYDTDEIVIATTAEDFEDRKESYRLIAELFL